MGYMSIGNAVRVSYKDDQDENNIGAIVSGTTEFVTVDFGKHSRRMSIGMLFDITHDTNS